MKTSTPHHRPTAQRDSTAARPAAARLKVLMCHNYYQWPGGEDLCFAAEAELLESYGHRVLQYTVHNDDIRRMGQLRLACRTVWNRHVYRQLRELARRERPAVVHFTNTFPLISPAAYYAVRREGAAVVQSLHNYRLLCPESRFQRQQRVCEKCLGKWFPWPAVRHACYREDRAATSVVTAMLTLHRAMGTWTRAVDAYCALTEFSRRKFVSGGLPADKIVIKPNFLCPDPGPGSGESDCAIFVGRLATEKGIDVLLQAWSRISLPISLQIVGDGPLAPLVQQAAENDPRIDWLGWQEPEDVSRRIGQAACLVLPSIWYEGLPRTIVEAYSRGTPVIASRLGSMLELIDDGCNGLHAAPGDARDLAETIIRFWSAGSDRQRMRKLARQTFEDHFTPEKNYLALLDLYERALDARHGPHHTAVQHPEVEH